MQAVADGDADFAAIDAVSFKMLQAWDNACGEVAVLGTSPPVPGLPLITGNANATRAPDLFAAMEAAIAGVSGDCRDRLHLRGILPARPEDYACLHWADEEVEAL